MYYSALDVKSQSNIAEETITPERVDVAEMQNRVFVIDTNKTPLSPCHPARARELLDNYKAAIYRTFPFTIILKHKVEPTPDPIQFKVDPGSKTTGMVLVQNHNVIWAAELEHRGELIKSRLLKRRNIRRSRRVRKTRYRKPGNISNNMYTSIRKTGWLPPSLKSRVDNIDNWINKLSKFVPIDSISMELNRFDTQLMQNPEISGIEYRQGELSGYQIREYLLEKFDRTCCYCKKINTKLEIEHIIPKSRGGSNRVSNLCLACEKCNSDKGNLTATEFGFPNIQLLTKKSLKDATVINVTRSSILDAMKKFGLQIEVGDGGRTKFNRCRNKYAKTHWIDAACIGESGYNVFVNEKLKPLLIKAMGRGRRQMCLFNKFGFPRSSAKSNKTVFGFRTGDIVVANVPSGKNKGEINGRVSVASSGRFKIGPTQSISHKYCDIIQKNDGYSYQY